jgi:hypothetical protein
MATNAVASTRTSKQALHNAVFGGNQPDSMPIITKITTGAPAMAAPSIGTFCYNAFDNVWYICTVISGTWVQITA